MPRSFSRAEQGYAPNTNGTPRVYGPFALDSFTRDDTDLIEWTATVVDWPPDQGLVLAEARVSWNIGYESMQPICGGPRMKDGTPMALKRERVWVPREGPAGKGGVVSGSVTLTVHVAFRTALAAQALAA